MAKHHINDSRADYQGLPIAAFASGQAITMSSREIAELCEKRHDHVLRDIEKMLQDIADPKFGASDFASTYKDSTGRTLKEYRLPKDLTVALITGYRADLRYKVVKRLEELEGQGVPAMLSGPQLMAAALIEADATMKAQAKQIESMSEDVAAHERLTKADGSLNVTEAAKNLGIRPKTSSTGCRTTAGFTNGPARRTGLATSRSATKGCWNTKAPRSFGPMAPRRSRSRSASRPRGCRCWRS